VLAVVLAPLATSACGEPESTLSTRSDVEVRLPSAPNLGQRPEPPTFPDGALSVGGLMAVADTHVGRAVTVRGLVADTVVCKPSEGADKAEQGKGKDKGKAEEPVCHPPSHLYLADDVKAQRDRLLIVGWSAKKVGGVRRGQQLTFHGGFQRVSPDGTFIRQAGLLVVPE